MRRLFILSFMFVPLLFGASKSQERLGEATTVLHEIMDTPDKGIPKDLLNKAVCVVVVPGFKKGAFILGAQYGKGYVSCRRSGGRGWSAPATVRMEGGSVGFQIGATETDVVLLVMNATGADKLMKSKF